MGMGTRKQRERQDQLWITHAELVSGPDHPFYKQLNRLLDGERFDEFCERECTRFYADNYGRPSFDAGHVLPADAGGLLRGYRFGTWYRLAGS